MNKIDTVQWKTFKISDLFITSKKKGKIYVPTGASIPAKNLEPGDIPRITVTAFNNGSCGSFAKMENNPHYRIYENFISVSFLGTVFYHQGKASLDMKVHCLKPKKIALNPYTGLFLVTVIRKCIQNTSYADQISSTVLPKLKIKLPADRHGKPDFAYMETYMKNKEETVNASLTILQSLLD